MTTKPIHWQWRLAQILVIEDNPADCHLLEEFFERHHLANHVKFCASLQDAACYMERHTIDLLFLDVELPDGNGLDFLSDQIIAAGWLRRDATGHYPVVVMSGSTRLEHLHNARGQGVYIYMDKPLDITKLHAVIRLLDAFHLGILLDEKVASMEAE